MSSLAAAEVAAAEAAAAVAAVQEEDVAVPDVERAIVSFKDAVKPVRIVALEMTLAVAAARVIKG